MPDLAQAPTKDLEARVAELKGEINERREELQSLKAELEERGRAERARASVAAMTPAEREAAKQALEEAAKAEETDQ